MAPVFLQGAPVELPQRVDPFPDLVPDVAVQQRRVVGEDAVTVDDPRQLGEDLQAVAAASLFEGFLGLLAVAESAIRSMPSSTLTREYQTSSSPISEYSAIL